MLKLSYGNYYWKQSSPITNRRLLLTVESEIDTFDSDNRVLFLRRHSRSNTEFTSPIRKTNKSFSVIYIESSCRAGVIVSTQEDMDG